jgi:hypothetical protein
MASVVKREPSAVQVCQVAGAWNSLAGLVLTLALSMPDWLNW